MQIKVCLVEYGNRKQGQDLIMLMSEYARDPMGGENDLTADVKANLVTKLANISGAFSVIAYMGGKPAGLINCFEGFSTFRCKPLVNIHDVIVSKEFRGEGISHRMLEKVEQIAIEKGCCKLTLEVLQENQVAQQSYESFGFLAYTLDPEMGSAFFWEKKL